MRVFPQKPIICKCDEQYWWKPTRWILNEDYEITLLDGTRIVVPYSFEFETSIPRIIHPVLGPTGTLHIPGLFHDFLYEYNIFGWDKAYCDYVFWEIAERVRHRKYAHRVALYGVQIAGWRAWERHRAKEKNNDTD